jgi:hypothetical protein
MKTVWALTVLAFLWVPFSASGEEEGWIQMFDGQTLDGWKANENPEQWKVIDGAIVAHGQRSHLFYVGNDPNNPPEFKNFHWKADVQTKPKSNSGVFFHTKFQRDGWPETGIEAQVNQTQRDPVKTGSLYNIKKNFEAPANDNEWWNYEIIVTGKHVVTKVNGKTIIEYDEPADITKEPKLGAGTFALQAHDPGSTAMYKNIFVKKLP